MRFGCRCRTARSQSFSLNLGRPQLSGPWTHATCGLMRGVLALLALGFATTTVAAGSPLFDAVAAGDRTGVEQVLAKGENVDSRARDQATPLIAAALGNQVAIVELLLSKGASVTARNSGGFTPLHAAADAGSVPIAKLLLDKGATLDDAANKAGVTPLMVAGERNHVEVAEFLLTRGADANHPEVHGYLPMTRALWKGNKDIVRLYKRHGVACGAAEILGSDEWVRRCEDIGK
jgi:ankyrin repeat protein